MKPDKPGELRDVTVNAISLVPKAANGERFKVFKSAEEEPKTQAPETVKKDERGLFHILKEFFTGAEVKKGEVADVLDAKSRKHKFTEAMNALYHVLGFDYYVDGDNKPETDPAKIIAAIDDFRNVAIEILVGKNEIEKSGRKISGSRLSKLKNIQAMLNEVLSGLDKDEDNLQEAEELTKEEVQKAVEEAVKTIDVKEIVKGELAPIIERIEKIENARGISNRVQEDTTLEKSGNDFWGGVF